jgi:hypothetical protein
MIQGWHFLNPMSQLSPRTLRKYFYTHVNIELGLVDSPFHLVESNHKQAFPR